MKALIALLLLFPIIHAKESKPEDIRIIVSEFSEVKKDYLLTRKEFSENASRVKDFGKVSWNIPAMVKRAENHINRILVPVVSPSIKWPREGYNDGADYPVGAGMDLTFRAIELCRDSSLNEEFLFWRIDFRLVGPVGDQHSICVVCYLNGEIAKIVEHKDED
jgi:hypothetical protein